jgi:magnesium transporter
MVGGSADVSRRAARGVGPGADGGHGVAAGKEPMTRIRRVFRTRFSLPGAAPGSLPPDAGPPHATIVLVTYDANSLARREAATVAEAVKMTRGPESAWLRIVGHDPAVLAELVSCCGLHPLVAEDVHTAGLRPKLEPYPGYVFVVLQVMRVREDGEIDEEQVSLILFKDLLVTIEERENALFRPLDERLAAARGRIRSAGLDYLAYAVVDTVVDYLFPLLDEVGERIERVEEELLDAPDQSSLERLHGLKRELLRARRVAWPTRDLLSTLSRGELDVFGEESRVYLRNTYDHAVQVLDMVETFREMTTSLVDLYLSSVSNRMNEVMKVLTIIATIFIPLTFIAGVYGMNFDTRAGPLAMPELHWAFGYPLVVAVMAVIAVAMLYLFKRRGWL